MLFACHAYAAQGRARLADALQHRRAMEQELQAAKERAEALELQLQDERGRVRGRTHRCSAHCLASFEL